MPENTTNEDVPEELKKSRESKDLASQKAEDEAKSGIKRGEAFLVAIGYISFLCILPLVLLRGSKFAQYHGKQALVLAIVIYFFDFFNLVQVFNFISFFRIISPLLATLYTGIKTIVIIYSIYMSFNGKYFKIPFIYSLSEKFNINIKQEK